MEEEKTINFTRNFLEIKNLINKIRKQIERMREEDRQRKFSPDFFTIEQKLNEIESEVFYLTFKIKREVENEVDDRNF